MIYKNASYKALPIFTMPIYSTITCTTENLKNHCSIFPTPPLSTHIQILLPIMCNHIVLPQVKLSQIKSCSWEPILVGLVNSVRAQQEHSASDKHIQLPHR